MYNSYLKYDMVSISMLGSGSGWLVPFLKLKIKVDYLYTILTNLTWTNPGGFAPRPPVAEMDIGPGRNEKWTGQKLIVDRAELKSGPGKN